MVFEAFWEDYLKEREKYHDYAWTSILIQRINTLSQHEKQIIFDRLLFFVQSKVNDWETALDVIESLGSEKELTTLIQIIHDLSDKIDSDRYGYIIKVLATRGACKPLISNYLQCAPIGSAWRFVVKNLPNSMDDLFLEAFQRFFREQSKLGFDFEQYLKHRPDIVRFLRDNFVNNPKVVKMLNIL